MDTSVIPQYQAPWCVLVGELLDQEGHPTVLRGGLVYPFRPPALPYLRYLAVPQPRAELEQLLDASGVAASPVIETLVSSGAVAELPGAADVNGGSSFESSMLHRLRVVIRGPLSEAERVRRAFWFSDGRSGGPDDLEGMVTALLVAVACQEGRSIERAAEVVARRVDADVSSVLSVFLTHLPAMLRSGVATLDEVSAP